MPSRGCREVLDHDIYDALTDYTTTLVDTFYFHSHGIYEKPMWLKIRDIYTEERRKRKREGHLQLVEKGCVRGEYQTLLHSCGDLDGTLALSAMVVTELAKFLALPLGE